MAGISVGATTSSSFELFISNLDTSWGNGTRTVWWHIGSPNGGIPTENNYYDIKQGKSIENYASSGGHVKFYGLESGTRYGVLCQIYWFDHTLDENGEEIGTTLLKELVGEVYTDEEESYNWILATSDFGNMDTKYTNYLHDDLSDLFKYYYSLMYRTEVTFDEDCHVEIYSEGSLDVYGYFGTRPDFDDGIGVPFDFDIADDSSNGGVNFKISCDVTAGTYYVWVRACYPDELGATSLHINVSEISESVGIDKWDWFSSNGSAEAYETEDAYNAVYYRQPTTNFSHKVWNDMVEKVYEIAFAKTKWWDEDYASVYDTKFHTKPYELTAVMFNSLRNNIELTGNRSDVLGYKTGIGTVILGDEVDGEYFLTLAEYINDCIDNL